MNSTILFVDDDQLALSSIARVIDGRFNAKYCNDPEIALTLIKGEDFKVIVSDLRMPKMDGIALLHEAKQIQPHASRILYSGVAEVYDAVDAVRLAEVYRILLKPCHTETLYLNLEAAIDHSNQASATAQRADANLQKIFYHDVLNAAACVHGYLSILKSEIAFEDKTLIGSAGRALEDMIELIRSQRDLEAAQNSQLQINECLIDVAFELNLIANHYRSAPVGIDKTIRVEAPKKTFHIKSDATLLRRILGNFLKNALEASKLREEVVIGCEEVQGHIKIFVKNDAIIPDNLRPYIFTINHTTKGTGRGIGTYSAKIIGERYLHGKVNFITASGRGTEFYIILPLLNSLIDL